MADQEGDGSSAARVRWVGAALGVASVCATLVLPPPPGLSIEGWRVAGLAVLMASWWMTEALPAGVTALAPLVALPLLGAGTMATVSGAYAHPLLFLMLGGFVIGHAMERVGLHLRLTIALLRPAMVRRSPGRVLGALMVSAALISALVSNTATMMMMLPIAMAVARACAADDRHVPPYVLGVAYACSIGGMATLVGTPTNAVLAGIAMDTAGAKVSFAGWMVYGTSVAVCLLPAAWWCVNRAFSLPGAFLEPVTPPPLPPRHVAGVGVSLVVFGSVLAWLSRGDLDLGTTVIPGWGRVFQGSDQELDAMVALVAAFVLFLLPGGFEADGRRRSLLAWHEVERAIPWSVLLLIGGGFALAKAIADSGLTVWLSGGAAILATVPLPVTVLVLTLVVTLVSELASNMATAQIVLPILAEAAKVARVSPMLWMAPATLAASCGFMLPVATPPNAIAAQAGGVTSRQMMRAGILLDVLAAGVLTVVSLIVVPLVFGP